MIDILFVPGEIRISTTHTAAFLLGIVLGIVLGVATFIGGFYVGMLGM